METIEIKHVATRAKSIGEFRSDHPPYSRVLKMPYYRQRSAGVFTFEFITEDTDANELKALIEQGLIYVIKKGGESGGIRDKGEGLRAES